MVICGGLAFWAANFATSLLPIAAEYRAALSIAYLPMVLVESLLGGLAIAAFVSYFLLRFFDRIPARNSIFKACVLSCLTLGISTIITAGASKLLQQDDAVRYFFIGAVLNVPRFLILGFAVGYLYKRLYPSAPT